MQLNFIQADHLDRQADHLDRQADHLDQDKYTLSKKKKRKGASAPIYSQ